MEGDGRTRDRQPVCDLAAAQPFGQQTRDLGFHRCQAEQLAKRRSVHRRFAVCAAQYQHGDRLIMVRVRWQRHPDNHELAPIVQAQPRRRYPFTRGQPCDQRGQLPAIFAAGGNTPTQRDSGRARQVLGQRVGMDHAAIGIEQHHAKSQAVEGGQARPISGMARNLCIRFRRVSTVARSRS